MHHPIAVGQLELLPDHPDGLFQRRWKPGADARVHQGHTEPGFLFARLACVGLQTRLHLVRADFLEQQYCNDARRHRRIVVLDEPHQAVRLVAARTARQRP